MRADLVQRISTYAEDKLKDKISIRFVPNMPMGKIELSYEVFPKRFEQGSAAKLKVIDSERGYTILEETVRVCYGDNPKSVILTLPNSSRQGNDMRAILYRGLCENIKDGGKGRYVFELSREDYVK